MSTDKRRFAVGILKLLLAHHPCCKEFDDDIIKVGEIRICIGCIIFIPFVLLTITFLFGDLLKLGRNYHFFGATGIILGTAQIFSLLLHIRRKIFKVMVKISLGIGVGFVLYSIHLLPVKNIHKFVILMLCMTLASLLEILKVFRMKKRCEECDSYPDIPNCEGLYHFSD